MPGGPTAIERLQEERYQLQRIGVSYADWRLMPRWTRSDLLLRHGQRVGRFGERAKGGLQGLARGVVEWFLGL